MLSSPWVLEGPFTYVRPLGPTEEIFYWDGLFEGTADSTTSVEIETQHVSRESIISQANVETIWISLKLKYPLLGSRIIRRSDQSLWFYVESNRLSSVGPGELHFHDVASAEEASVISSQLLKHPRMLSTDLLACALILRRTDDRARFHIVIYAAHSITDGNANAALSQFFLNRLAGGAPHKSNGEDIKDRLALSSSCDDLNPVHHLSVPRKRWRRAVGAIIWKNRMLRLRVGCFCSWLQYLIAFMLINFLLREVTLYRVKSQTPLPTSQLVLDVWLWSSLKKKLEVSCRDAAKLGTPLETFSL